MKTLVLGAGGMLATDLVGAAPGVEVVARTVEELDVTQEAAVRAALATTKPDVILNAAAYTDVDGAETHRDAAFRVNGEAPGFIGRAADTDTLVVHFSTDYVFDGHRRTTYREDDPPSPLNTYGASKLLGEQALAASGARYLIVRTQWLFGVAGRSFPRTMWERARTRRATRVVNDQFGRPTGTVDFARAVWRLIATVMPMVPSDAPFIVHVANTGAVSWYDVARRVFDRASAADCLTPCSTAEYPASAARPAHAVLDTSRYERLTGDRLPRWEDGLDRFLDVLGRKAQ